jgi:hypothetical protein
MMRSSQTSTDASGPMQPLKVSVEVLANLIYLARRAPRRIPSGTDISIGRPKLLRDCSIIRSFASELRRSDKHV